MLSSLLAAAASDLMSLSVPAVCVPDDRTCESVDRLFLRDADLTAVAVTRSDGCVGLLSRSHLTQTMSGPLGYGRLLHAQRPVSEVASWSPLVLDAATGVVEAATQIVVRAQDRWDDVLVRTPEGLRLAGAAAVLQALAGAFAARATHDDLTGLPNRAMFLGQLAAACSRLLESDDRSLAVLYIDLDGFKAINDARGHNAGDAALVAAAARLVSVARAGDLVARLSGDEFAVLLELPHRDLQGATDGPAQRAAAAGERYRSALTGGDPALRASVGVAVCSPGSADGETLLREADMAMYSAKRAGGARVVVIDGVGDHLTLSASGRLEANPDDAVRDALLVAMRTDQLVLHYQPIVRLSDHAVVSVEALVRWRHPDRGLLAPGAFLPDAERLGLLADLDAWVIDHALGDYAGWRDRDVPGLPAYLNVNLSRPTLARVDLLEMVTTSLRHHNVPARHLRLELVEDADTDLLTAATPQLDALRVHGVSLTWDDMGSGASSLKHVTQLTVDGLKIDRAFVSDLHTTHSALAVVRMLVSLATGLGLVVTAEGVETAEQLATLTELGAGYAQGFYLARPAPAGQLLQLLAAWPRGGGGARLQSRTAAAR